MKNNKDSIATKFTAKEDPAFAGSLHQYDINMLVVPDVILKKLEKDGYDHRWINEVEFRKNFNMHKSGWLPYHIKNERAMSSFDGIDSAGALRRGDLILAVRPKEMTESRRKRINEQLARQSGSKVQKRKAEEFKQVMKDTGLDKYEGSKLLEGFDANGDEE